MRRRIVLLAAVVLGAVAAGAVWVQRDEPEERRPDLVAAGWLPVWRAEATASLPAALEEGARGRESILAASQVEEVPVGQEDAVR